MFELIIFIIIISWVFKTKKKKAETKPNVPRKRDASETAYAFQSQQSAATGNLQNQMRKKQASQNVQRRQPTPAGARTTSPNSQSRPVSSMVRDDQDLKMSTTDMLEAKAQLDNREHILEKQRQHIENKKYYGSHNYAKKYILGDPVPKGNKMVFCTYCNAENLIPIYSAARDYNCYFCRENL